MTDHKPDNPNSASGANTPPREPEYPASPKQQELITHGEKIDKPSHSVIVERR